MTAKIPDDVVLPCGCFIRCVVENGVNTLMYSPCTPSCVNLHNALELADEKDVSVEYRTGR